MIKPTQRHRRIRAIAFPPFINFFLLALYINGHDATAFVFSPTTRGVQSSRHTPLSHGAFRATPPIRRTSSSRLAISPQEISDTTASIGSLFTGTIMGDSGFTIATTSDSATAVSLAAWVILFAASHIGLSAIRTTLIHSIGTWADERLGIVDTIAWELPDLWPGDDVGQQRIFPDRETTGRQVYRALYTAVSFVTLGAALQTYLDLISATDNSTSWSSLLSLNETGMLVAHVVASICFGISIASLINPSPLSLVPGFVLPPGKESTNNNSILPAKQRKAVLVERQDSLKLDPRGLTRITRHPLILPVVPWGMATALLVGGRLPDLVLFGGLAVYAVAGCAAQDLRIQKEEGSVGTVFAPITSSGATVSSSSSLQIFYDSTSFVPFAAIADGRQSGIEAREEFPFLALLFGCVVGHFLQNAIEGLLAAS